MSKIFTSKSRDEIIFEFKTKTSEFVKILYSKECMENKDFNVEKTAKFFNQYLDSVFREYY